MVKPSLLKICSPICSLRGLSLSLGTVHACSYYPRASYLPFFLSLQSSSKSFLSLHSQPKTGQNYDFLFFLVCGVFLHWRASCLRRPQPETQTASRHPSIASIYPSSSALISANVDSPSSRTSLPWRSSSPFFPHQTNLPWDSIGPVHAGILINGVVPWAPVNPKTI